MQLPYKLVSLMELLQVYGQDFCQLSTLLAETEVFLLNGGVLDEEHFKRLFWALGAARKWAETLELHATGDKCTDVLAAIHSGVASQSLSTALAEVASRMRSELARRRLLYVPSTACDYFDKSQFPREAEQCFPAATEDMIEAGKCFALARYTACVFHLSRVVEVGLRTLTDRVGVKLKHDWGSQLREIENELKRRYSSATARSEDERFYSEAASLLGHVRVAWRNPTMHIDRRYNDEVAREVFNAVVALMRHLATGFSTTASVSP